MSVVDLEAISKALNQISVADRFMLFCELERKVDADRVGRISRGTMVLCYLPETTRAPGRKWPQSYWTLGRVYRCSTTTVYVREVTPTGMDTGLLLKFPRQFAIELKGSTTETSLLEKLQGIDRELKVAWAPFTTDPSHYSIPLAAFLSEAQPEASPAEEHIKPMPETKPETKPSATRKKKGRFSLKGRAL